MLNLPVVVEQQVFAFLSDVVSFARKLKIKIKKIVVVDKILIVMSICSSVGRAAERKGAHFFAHFFQEILRELLS